MQPFPRRWLSSPLLFVFLLGGCATTAPTSLMQAGSRDRFTSCSSAPHCVSSQAESTSSHSIAPLRYTGDADHARTALLETLRAINNSTVDDPTGPLAHATFHSRIVGFVDDVTFLLQPQSDFIDVKSTSRLGFYDFGVNRNRVERLRAGFEMRVEQAQEAASQ